MLFTAENWLMSVTETKLIIKLSKKKQSLKNVKLQPNASHSAGMLVTWISFLFQENKHGVFNLHTNPILYGNAAFSERKKYSL